MRARWEDVWWIASLCSYFIFGVRVKYGIRDLWIWQKILEKCEKIAKLMLEKCIWGIVSL